MLKQQKDLLRSLVTDLRHTLDGALDDAGGNPIRGDLDRELERIGIGTDGTITPLDALPNRTPHDERAHRVAAVQLSSIAPEERSAVRKEIVERAAYTWINRLLALRTMEARGLIEETLRANPAYEGVSEALYMLRYEQPQRTAGPDGGWRAVVENAWEAQAKALPGLFDLQDPNAALRPSTPALLHCVRAVGRPELDAVFADPDAISWAYQFYQEEAKARVYAKLAAGGKIETRSEIAAATQLFTEPYMVKWLLQNSLGRSYAEAYPDSALPQTWEYYIDREKILAEQDGDGEKGQAETGRRPLFTLDELTFMDPCPGSGHFLREAFDMLFAMYREQHPHMEARAIADRILSHHLHGLDIDPRAVQLCAITLALRAWETVGDGPYTPPALNLATTPSRLNAGALERHLQRYPEDETYRPILEGVFAALEQAPILGSLIKPEEHLDAAIQEFRQARRGGQMRLVAEDETANRLLAELARHDPDELKKLLLERVARSFGREARESDVSAQLLGREAGEGVHMLQLLGRKYAVVGTNPPYMGSGNMDAPLRRYVEAHYRPGKRDLYAAFILRCLELAHYGGRVAMITQQSWMFLKSFAELRAVPEEGLAKAKQQGEFTGLLRETCVEGLAHLGPNAFEEISGEVVQSAMFTLGKHVPTPNSEIVAVRLIAVGSSTAKADRLRTCNLGATVFVMTQSRLTGIIEAPLLYWISADLMTLLTGQTVGDVAMPVAGLCTGDESRFSRFRWETLNDDGHRWFPYEKGGGYRKWDGFRTFSVDWQFTGTRVKNCQLPGTRVQNEQYYFFPGLTYSSMAQGSIAVRKISDSLWASVTADAVISSEKWVDLLAVVLNSHVASGVLRWIRPQLVVSAGYVSRLPLPDCVEEPTGTSLGTIGRLCSHLKSKLVSLDILEATYSDDRCSSLMDGCALTLHSFLHSAEGVAQRVIFDSFGLSSADTASILGETGTPAGWHPLIAGYDALPDLPAAPSAGSGQAVDLPPLPQEVLDYLARHERIRLGAGELSSVKANLTALYAAGPGAKTDDPSASSGQALDLEDLERHGDDEEEGASGAYIPIPTETFLEELSVKLKLHPISVYWLLEELRGEGVRCKPEEKRLLEDRLTVLILRLLGHRWPKQIEAGEPVPNWADRDGVIPLSAGTGEPTLADRVRARLRAEDGDLGAQQVEALLHELTGRDLEEWLRRDFFKCHTSQFKRRPIAWHLASDPTAAGRKRGAPPAFECMVYYHRTDSDVLARIRTQYVDRLLAPAQRDLAHARQTGDETSAAQATALIQELEDFARRLRRVEEEAFACKDLDAYVEKEPLDRWAGDGVFAPGSRAELLAQEQAWQVDINDGVRVNIAPLQQAGLLAGDVLAKKDVPKAIADRARWRSDERRWVRAGKLPRCGWMDESVPESPKWTELAPEREAERVRLEEKRQRVLAELNA